MKVYDIIVVFCVEWELMLFKINVIISMCLEVIEIVIIFWVWVVDVGEDLLIIEVVGDLGKMVVIV